MLPIFFIVLCLLAILFGLLWLNSIFTSEPDQPTTTNVPSERLVLVTPKVPDLFDEGRIKSDLARLSDQPTALAQYIAQAQVRFTQKRQMAVLARWTEFYNAGKAVIAARTELARAHADLQQVSTETEIKLKEKEVKIAALNAELEEAALRKDDARIKRDNLGKETKTAEPTEPKLTPEQERILKKDEIELKLARVRQQKATAETSAVNEEGRVRVANMHDDRIEELLQELREYL